MTEDFEDLVRAAGRSLGTSRELPTYHDAWRRGRRRRMAKRGALAAAGAIALVLAFGGDLGRLPGGDRVEVDDVASEAFGSSEPPLATAPVFEPTPVPTTGPVGAAPDLDIDSAAEAAAPDSAAASALDQPPASDRVGDGDDAGASTLPTVTPRPATAAQDGLGRPTPGPTSPAAATDTTATGPPTAAATPPMSSPATGPTAVPDTASGPDGQLDTAESPPVDSTAVGVTARPGANAPTATPVPGDQRGEGEGPDGLVDPTEFPVVAVPTAVVTGQPADASIAVVGPTTSDGRPCDTDGDGAPDARCRLLVDYACTARTQLRAGFAIVDLDGDGAFDRCVPDVPTGCDLDGDGRADVACIIRPDQDSSQASAGSGP